MERLDENQGRFDLIITDLRMPILNGENVLRAVKAALLEVPVIVITAFGSPEKQAECRKDGAAAFLEKPLDTPQLLAAIDQVVSAPSPCHEGKGRGLSRLCKQRNRLSHSPTGLSSPPSSRQARRQA
jgi:DNA-binding NtrC family response regulator